MADIKDFIDQIAGEKYSEAGDTFNSFMSDRLNAALETEKMNVASDIFGEGETDVEDPNDIDLDEVDLDVEDQE